MSSRIAYVAIDGEQRSRDSLIERAQRLAGVFKSRNVKPGDAVAFLLRNDFVAMEANLAVRQLDAYGVPINWHWHAEEIEYVLADCAPKLLLGHRELLAGVAAILPPQLPVISVGEGRDWPGYEAVLEQQTPYRLAGRGLGSSMVYTSGTTGRPKAVKRLPASEQESAQRARVLAFIHDTSPDNVALVTGPLYHLFSQALAMATFAAAGSVVIMSRFDPERFLALVEAHRVTHAALVPTLFTRLLRLPADIRRRYDLRSLRHVVHSGAPCPPEVKRAMIDWWGPVLHETYGSSETGVVTKISSEAWLAKPGSVGKAVLTGEIRIRGEDGHWVGPNIIGDIYLAMHGTPDFTFYGDPTKRAAVEYEGFITCGDIGWLDRDGDLFICDRRGDMLISGGVNVYPAEVEAALMTHPAIEDCAVFGVPDAEFGEAVAAYIQASPSSGLGRQDVRDHVRGRLAGYKVPRIVVITDKLPREETGKIRKRALRELAMREGGG